MSTFSCPVVEVKLEKHPNADSLSIAVVGGWNCVVKTSDFDNDRLGVYIPIDAIASKEHPLLAFLEGKKVKTKKLRGVISQGVLIPISRLLDIYPLDFKKLPDIGDDVSAVLQIKKWEEPVIPARLGGGKKQNDIHEVVQRPDWLSKYIDIENWNNYANVIQEGEEVLITEKLHGTSAIFALVDDKYYVCSRNRCLRLDPTVLYLTYELPMFLRKLCDRFSILKRVLGKKLVIEPENSVWHQIFNTHDIKNKLLKLRQLLHLDRVAIYGEIIGVQDLMYGLKTGELDFYAYDIRQESDEYECTEDYLPPDRFVYYCKELGLKHVPVLFRGPFKKELLDLRLGNTTIPNASHIREGIVIDPIVPRVDRALGIVILKRVSEDYLMRKNQTDY